METVKFEIYSAVWLEEFFQFIKKKPLCFKFEVSPGTGSTQNFAPIFFDFFPTDLGGFTRDLQKKNFRGQSNAHATHSVKSLPPSSFPFNSRKQNNDPVFGPHYLVKQFSMALRTPVHFSSAHPYCKPLFYNVDFPSQLETSYSNSCPKENVCPGIV